jgi:proline iminopeptidase
LTLLAQTEQLIEVNGVRLWTKRHGSGVPLALLHGGPGMWDYFDDLAPLLEDAVVLHRYDQRGSGRSDRQPPYDVETFVADLDALRAHWGHERWIVAGHSWGAALALAYAASHPERTTGIIHMSGTGLLEDWHDEYHSNADARRSLDQRTRRAELRAVLKNGGTLTPEQDREYCILTWMADYVDPGRGRSEAEGMLRDGSPNYALNEAIGGDWSRLLADDAFVQQVRALQLPVLVLHGSEDPRPPRLAERLAASLRDARLAIIPKAGHLPWVEQPRATSRAIRSFLNSLSQ